MTLGKGGKWWEVFPTLINSGMRIKRDKEEKKREKMREGKRIEKRKKGGGRKEEKEKGRFSRSSDGRSSTVRELKLVHIMTAMRGYQNMGVSPNSKG